MPIKVNDPNILIFVECLVLPVRLNQQLFLRELPLNSKANRQYQEDKRDRPFFEE